MKNRKIPFLYAKLEDTRDFITILKKKFSSGKTLGLG